MNSYPEYYDTNLDWLKKIPVHWKLSKLGMCFIERNVKVSDVDYPALSVTKNGIVPQMENVAKSDAGDNRKKVCVDDFVINSRSDRKGSSGVSKYEGSVSLISTVLEPKRYLPRFANYLFRSYNFQEEFYRFGKGIVADLWSTRYSEMRNIYVPLVPIDEQEVISDFLDKEIDRIDSLISEKENFIQLLEEKRQALIAHVVTKGLDDKAEMKNSNVKPIGDVRADTKVIRFRYLFNFGRGLTITKENLKDKGIKVVNYGEIHSKFNFELDVTRDQLKFVDESYLLTSKECLIGKGDFVFADTSEDLDGSGNFTHLVSEEVIFAGYHTVVCRLKSKENSRFISYFLDSSAFRMQLQSIMKGVKVFSISQRALKDIWLCIPPLWLQNEIADYLDLQCSKIRSLTEETIKSIELLKEHRKALISAAVTGKIDVREKV